MNIALSSHDTRKELMIAFCKAHEALLSTHSLIATATTGKVISGHTNLSVTNLLSGRQGGIQQLTTRVDFSEIDVVIFFRDNTAYPFTDDELELMRACDVHNIPTATNISTAEVLISAIERGEIETAAAKKRRRTVKKERKVVTLRGF
ncbi:MAG: methylglyoxal synthase [Ruminococcaceae bacterium]|nr:methylglyoxal synthase [Oscillospiraceae bacterium]